MLAQAYNDNDQEAQKFVMKNFVKSVDAALKNINEQNTWDMLSKQDKDAGADTSEDPLLDDMRKRRVAQAEKPLAKWLAISKVHGTLHIFSFFFRSLWCSVRYALLHKNAATMTRNRGRDYLCTCKVRFK